jgi:hypothetical protein
MQAITGAVNPVVMLHWVQAIAGGWVAGIVRWKGLGLAWGRFSRILEATN